MCYVSDKEFNQELCSELCKVYEGRYVARSYDTTLQLAIFALSILATLISVPMCCAFILIDEYLEEPKKEAKEELKEITINNDSSNS
jgi:hypothetical protein